MLLCCFVFSSKLDDYVVVRLYLSCCVSAFGVVQMVATLATFSSDPASKAPDEQSCITCSATKLLCYNLVEYPCCRFSCSCIFWLFWNTNVMLLPCFSSRRSRFWLQLQNSHSVFLSLCMLLQVTLGVVGYCYLSYCCLLSRFVVLCYALCNVMLASEMAVLQLKKSPCNS
jgi:hypothetical protein